MKIPGIRERLHVRFRSYDEAVQFMREVHPDHCPLCRRYHGGESDWVERSNSEEAAVFRAFYLVGIKTECPNCRLGKPKRDEEFWKALFDRCSREEMAAARTAAGWLLVDEEETGA